MFREKNQLKNIGLAMLLLNNKLNIWSEMDTNEEQATKEHTGLMIPSNVGS